MDKELSRQNEESDADAENIYYNRNTWNVWRMDAATTDIRSGTGRVCFMDRPSGELAGRQAP